MTIRLYDLAGAEEDRRFSPFCWRTKMALAHKGLPVEEVAWRFTEKEAIAFSEQGKVPVIVDTANDDTSVCDSWEIAKYLDKQYPDAPLFPADEASVFFFKAWVERTLHPGIAKQVVLDVYKHLHEKDQDYFRTTREKVFGMTLEAVAEGAADALPGFRKSLGPMRVTLAEYDFIGGDAPSFADHIAFGHFAWARAISETKLLEADDPIYAWRERMLDLFDGFARKSPGYAV